MRDNVRSCTPAQVAPRRSAMTPMMPLPRRDGCEVDGRNSGEREKDQRADRRALEGDGCCFVESGSRWTRGWQKLGQGHGLGVARQRASTQEIKDPPSLSPGRRLQHFLIPFVRSQCFDELTRHLLNQLPDNRTNLTDGRGPHQHHHTYVRARAGPELSPDFQLTMETTNTTCNMDMCPSIRSSVPEHHLPLIHLACS